MTPAELSALPLSYLLAELQVIATHIERQELCFTPPEVVREVMRRLSAAPGVKTCRCGQPQGSCSSCSGSRFIVGAPEVGSDADLFVGQQCCDGFVKKGLRCKRCGEVAGDGVLAVDQRQRFEAWADDQGFPLKRLETSDGYLDLRTHGAWDAWQAALTDGVQEVPRG